MLKLSCNVTDHIHNLFSNSRRIFVPVHRQTRPISCFQLKKEPLRAILSADHWNSSVRVADTVSGTSPADRLRFGRLMEDGFSYKEKFIVRSYEVGINKTATIETIANLLQVWGFCVLCVLNILNTILVCCNVCLVGYVFVWLMFWVWICVGSGM